MIVPILPIQSKEELEAITDKYCYLIGNNGVFLKKETFAYKVIQKVFEQSKEKATIDGLIEIKEVAEVTVSKLPYKDIKKVTDFFAHIADSLSSEVVVYLYYNPETKKYDFIPPSQEVTGASITYGTMPVAKKGFKPLGTIHSHVDMSAFHSGTDENDQATFDGIHITVGKVREANPEFDVRLYIGKRDYGIKTETFITLRKKEKPVFPDNWEDKVTKKVYKSTVAVSAYPAYGGNYHSGDYYNKVETTSKKSKKTINKKINEFLVAISKRPKDIRSDFEVVSRAYIRYDAANKGKGGVSIVPSSAFEPTRVVAAETWNTFNHAEKKTWLFDKLIDLLDNTDYGYGHGWGV